MRSLLQIMALDLAVSDHTTLARRRRSVAVRETRWKRKGPIDIITDSTGLKFFGAGEWARAKHGETRRSWRKLHLSIDPATGKPHGGTERERHAAQIALRGRMAWQRQHRYGRRSLVETAISCIRRIIGGRLTSRTFGAQQNEVVIPIKIANRNMMLARPNSERVP